MSKTQHHIIDNNMKNRRSKTSMSKNIPFPTIEKYIYLSQIFSILGNGNFYCNVFVNNQIYKDSDNNNNSNYDIKKLIVHLPNNIDKKGRVMKDRFVLISVDSDTENNTIVHIYDNNDINYMLQNNIVALSDTKQLKETKETKEIMEQNLSESIIIVDSGKNVLLAYETDDMDDMDNDWIKI